MDAGEGALLFLPSARVNPHDPASAEGRGNRPRAPRDRPPADLLSGMRVLFLCPAAMARLARAVRRLGGEPLRHTAGPQAAPARPPPPADIAVIGGGPLPASATPSLAWLRHLHPDIVILQMPADGGRPPHSDDQGTGENNGPDVTLPVPAGPRQVLHALRQAARLVRFVRLARSAGCLPQHPLFRTGATHPQGSGAPDHFPAPILSAPSPHPSAAGRMPKPQAAGVVLTHDNRTRIGGPNMSFQNARSMYRKADAASAAELDSPHEIIQVTMRELERSLRVLASAVEAGAPCPDNHINRALTAIYILQSSLDFEKGGQIAGNLFQVYEYCRLRVVEAFQRQPTRELAIAADHIATLMSAWSQIGRTAPAR